MRFSLLVAALVMISPATALEVTVDVASPQEQELLLEACAEHDRAARIDGTATLAECVVELVNVAAQKLLRVKVERERHTTLREDQAAKMADWRSTFERQADLRVCGDAEPDAGEECDPGVGNFDDTTPNAACRSNCREPYCGDGVVDSGEMCDPGANTRCKSDCSGLAVVTP